jgi:heat shock protein HslJ
MDDSGDGDGEPATIVGTTWILGAPSAEALIGEAVPIDTRVTIRFADDGTAAGSAGCNSFGGSYTLGDDGALTIEPGAMTQMACEEPLMTLEAAYTSALADVYAAQVVDDGEGLILTGAETTLTYAAERPVALEGTRWRIDGLVIGTDAISSTIAGADADLTLEGGNLSGTTGCNRMTGGYETSGEAAEGSLSFGAIATTKMACEPDVGEQEQTILSGLEAVAAYRIEGEAMSLSDAEGSLLLTLAAD